MSKQDENVIITPPPCPDRPSRNVGFDGGGDFNRLHDTLGKVVSAVNRSAKNTEQIPEIKKRVEETREKVIALSSHMDDTRERVGRVESKVDAGYECKQEGSILDLKTVFKELDQKIDTDVQKGTEQAGTINALLKQTAGTEADVEDIKKAPRRMFYGLIGIIFTILTAVGGSVWFLAELNKEVEFESTQRRQQFRRIEKKLSSVARKADPKSILRQVRSLEESVERSNGHERDYNRICKKMSRREKRLVRSILIKRIGKVPATCTE